MKTIIMVIAGALMFGCSNAQKAKDADIPAAVKAGFEKEYPETKVVKWEKEGADYEAEFIWDQREASAVFDASGSFKEFEQEIGESELPLAATAYCMQHFAKYKIVECARISRTSGQVIYEAELKKGKTHFDLLFDEQGNFIEKGE